MDAVYAAKKHGGHHIHISIDSHLDPPVLTVWCSQTVN